ncbi:hypothetical protein [Kamptonema formosum]|uniref:hypothetical protein n=1 Tax=Kamptonema formosum TaxID=331992 RepID=UPI000349DF47|nr:hypothetical protein [Oscillatoria sp. PCC 10802]
MISQTLAELLSSGLLESLARLPEQEQLLQQVARRLKKGDRVDRWVAIHLPTKVDVKVLADFWLYVEQTQELMGQLFRDAIWNRQDGVNIVVRSSVTTEVLDRHLPTLVGFVCYLQYQLRQESMAMELDGEILWLEFP